MKRTLLFAVIMPGIAMAQQIIHSTANGAFSDPLNWDCLCIPDPEDKVYIHHSMTLEDNRTIVDGGVIYVLEGASLIQAQNKQLLVEGYESQLSVYGTASFDDITFTDDGEGVNYGQLSVDRTLHFGYNSSFTNSGVMDGMDSLVNNSVFTNHGEIYTGSFLNTVMVLNYGDIMADSMGNDGVFNTYAGGRITVATFGNTESFNMYEHGYLDVSGNWYNFDVFTVDVNPIVYVGGNAYNGDTLDGSLLIKGGMTVNGDFINMDNVTGMGGRICLGGYSSNTGTFSGSLDFCDATGGNIDLNTGTVGGGITFCTNGCNLGIETNGGEAITLYPNPASGKLFIESSTAFETVEFYSLAGEKVLSAPINEKAIALDGLKAGVYFVNLIGETIMPPMKVIVE